MADTNTSIQFILLVILSFGFLETVKLGSCNGSHNASCMEIERKALLNFKEGLIDPSDRLSSWVGKDCCRWEGVKCSNKSGHVIKLKLRNPYTRDPEYDGTDNEDALGGEISTSLLDLKHLEYLDLSMNNFGGIPIPKFIGSLKILRYLNLSGAFFGGTIPPHLGNLSSLRYLDLDTFDESNENNLNWLSGLSSLKYLNLGYFNLSEAKSHWIQAVNMLPSLLELHLPACGLSNLPPSVPFVNLTSLSVLDLPYNGFDSSIPSWLSNLSSLVYLDLSYNSLKSSIPDDFAELTALQHVILSRNYIEGKLPRTLGKLCKLQILDLSSNNISGDMTEVINGLGKCPSCNLESLILYSNKLGGSLPDSLGQLRNLKYLYLGRNSFSGSIPESIGNLSSLEFFDLFNNQMKGTIPSSLGQLTALVAFDFSFNQWEGVITAAHFSNLTSLKELSIDQSFTNSTLVFKVSTEWIPPFKLTYLNLKSCQLGPEFPAWLRNQNELNSVVLVNAKLADIVPEWFWKLNLSLNQLYLSNNQLRGRVPTTMKFPPQSAISLNNNSFEGPLPLWSSNVTYLHLDNNMFSGPIPMDIGERMPMLVEIDISHNSLNGTIPTSIRKLSLLATLVVSNNRLTGKIPEGLTNLSRLGTLNLSMNHLTGQIPANMGNLQWLDTLDLSKNHLSGTIPPSMASMTSLKHLNLSYNNLSGVIPSTKQFKTFNDPSIYEGNPALCGQPLPTKCNGGRLSEISSYEKTNEQGRN